MSVRPQLRRWLCAVILEWIVVAVTLAAMLTAWRYHWLIWPLGCIIIGSRQHAIAILGHDGAHRLACQNAKLNDTLTRLCCFWPLLTGLEEYRRFHFQHHRALGSPADPELPAKQGWSWRPPFTAAKFAIIVIGDCLGLGLPYVIGAMRFFHPRTLLDAAGVGILMALTGWLDWRIPAIWFGCLGTTFWAIFRMRAITEHIGTSTTHLLARPPLWARLLFLPHNTWCHHAHHAHPAVPFWALPEIAEQPGRTLPEALDDMC